MQHAPRILIAGGGTGGHVYPAIAIADAIRALEPEASIEFAGTEEKLEWTAVPKAGYAIQPITVQGFHRKQMMRNLGFPFKLMKGLVQSRSLVKAFDPDVAVGTGGFVAGPVLMAAHWQKRPIVLQEQNAFPGVTNKLLGPRATEIHIAFEAARERFPGDRCLLSGNPTRKALQNVDKAEARRHFGFPDDARVVFMFGGSLGSSALNGAMQQHHEALLQDPKLALIWQTGSLYYERVRTEVAEHPRLHLLRYVDRMDLAYAAADLVVARAGAISCSEIMIAARPSLLVPSPNVAEDHQTKNAESMAGNGASKVLPESELNEKLGDEIVALMRHPEKREAMGNAAGALARPEAAETIARHVLEIARRYRA